MATPQLKYANNGIRNTDLYTADDFVKDFSDIKIPKSTYAITGADFEPYYQDSSNPGYMQVSDIDEPTHRYVDSNVSDRFNYDYQSNFEALRNILGRGATLFATTALRNTIGFIDGLFEGSQSDNTINNALFSLENWVREDLMPVYEDPNRENNSFLKNTLGSAAWWAGMAESIGMATGSGVVGGLYMKAFGALARVAGISRSTLTPVVSGLASAGISSSGEAAMEAQDLRQEMTLTQKQTIDGMYLPQLQQLQQQGYNENNSQEYANLLNEYQQADKEAEINADRAAQATYWGNLPFLMLQEGIFYGKMLSRGYKTGAKLNGMRSPIKVRGSLGEYKGLSKLEKGYNLGKRVGGSVYEGFEEMTQNAIKTGAEAYYQNSFLNKDDDPEARDAAGNFMNSVMYSIGKTVGDERAWEEGFAGAIMGFAGMPTPRLPYNRKTKKWRNPFTLEGGIYNSIKDWKKENAESEQLAADLNKFTSGYNKAIDERDPEADGIVETTNYYKQFVNNMESLERSISYVNQQNEAIDNRDVFKYKNAEFAELFNHINLFSKAGRLQDMRDMVNTILDSSSDEKVQSIIDATSSENTDPSTGKKQMVGPYLKADGTVDLEYAKEAIDKQRDYLIKNIDKYSDLIEDLHTSTGGILSDEQVNELAYMKMASDNMMERTEELRTSLNDLIKGTAERKGILEEYENILNGGQQHDSNETAAKLAALTNTLNNVNDLLYNKKSIRKDLEKASKTVDELANELQKTAEAGIDKNFAQPVKNAFNDLVSLIVAQRDYNNKFSEFLADPKNIEKEKNKRAKAKKEKELNENANKAKTSFKDAIKKAKNLAEAHQIITKSLSDLQEISPNFTQETLFEDVKDEPIIKEYRRSRAIANSMKNTAAQIIDNKHLIEDAQADKVYKDVLKTAAELSIDDAVNSANRVDNLLNIDHINANSRNGSDHITENAPGLDIGLLYDILNETVERTKKGQENYRTNTNRPAPSKKDNPEIHNKKVKKTDIFKREEPQSDDTQPENSQPEGSQEGQKQKSQSTPVSAGTIITDNNGSYYQLTEDSKKPLIEIPVNLDTDLSEYTDKIKDTVETEALTEKELPNEFAVVDNDYIETSVDGTKTPNPQDTAAIDNYNKKALEAEHSSNYIESVVSEYDWNYLRDYRQAVPVDSKVVDYIKENGGFQWIREHANELGKAKLYYAVVNATVNKGTIKNAVMIVAKDGDKYIPIMKVLEEGAVQRGGKHEDYEQEAINISNMILSEYNRNLDNIDSVFESHNNGEIVVYDVKNPITIVKSKAGTFVFDKENRTNTLDTIYNSNDLINKRGISKPQDYYSIETDRENTTGVYLNVVTSTGQTVPIPVRPRPLDASAIQHAVDIKVGNTTLDSIMTDIREFVEGDCADDKIKRKIVKKLNTIAFNKDYFFIGTILENKDGFRSLALLTKHTKDRSVNKANTIIIDNTNIDKLPSLLERLLKGSTVNINEKDVRKLYLGEVNNYSKSQKRFEEFSRLVVINADNLIEHNAQVFAGIKDNNGNIRPLKSNKEMGTVNNGTPKIPTGNSRPKDNMGNVSGVGDSNILTRKAISRHINQKMRETGIRIKFGSMNLSATTDNNVASVGGSRVVAILPNGTKITLDFREGQAPMLNGKTPVNSLVQIDTAFGFNTVIQSTNKNSHLSNFANRPFTINRISEGAVNLKLPSIQFKSVEQAFQYLKKLYSKNTTENINTANYILSTNNPATAKALGKKFKDFDSTSWDAQSSSIMKALIRESFIQNPTALQQLLDTEDVQLTHIQDKSKWREEFPKILMEVREELREAQDKGTLQELQQSQVAEISTQNQQADDEWSDSLDEATASSANNESIKAAMQSYGNPYADSNTSDISIKDTKYSKKSLFRLKQSSTNTVKDTYKNKEVLDRESTWLEQALPQALESLNMVDNITTNGGIEAWGLFKNNAITVTRDAARGTIYHEAFHYVFHTVSSEKERSNLIEEIKKVYNNPNMSDQLAEETLAEEFREYRQSGESIIGKLSRSIKNFFKKLANFLHLSSKYSNTLDTYFRNIEQGTYSNKNIDTYKPSTDSINNILKDKGLSNEEIEELSDEEIAYVKRCMR